MEHASTTSLDLHTFLANLDVLREQQSALASTLEPYADDSSTWPALASARDGTSNFLLPGASGQTRWHGHSSIPRTRADALLTQFDPGQANVFLPGVGQGWETVMLLERLGVHRAVFVWEPNLDALRLALALHDFTAAIANERLVWLHGPPAQLAQTLCDTLLARPGHLCPNRILMWPWHTLADIAPIRNAVESAFQQVERHRQSEMQNLRRKLATPGSRSEDFSPHHVGLFSLHARENTWALSRAMHDAATSGGQAPSESTVRSPGDMHALARLKRLAEQSASPPDHAILIDVTRRQMKEVLPESLPTVCWLDHLPSDVDRPWTDHLEPCDLVAARNPRLVQELSDSDLPPERLVAVPPPCLVDQDRLDRGPSRSEKTYDVLIFADNLSLKPVHHGIHLPTHQQLWESAVSRLRERLAEFTPDTVNDCLSRAQNATGIRLEDPEQESAMIAKLAVVAHTLLADAIPQTLIKNSLKVCLCGMGFSTSGTLTGAKPPADLDERVRQVASANVLVHLNIQGDRMMDPLLAAGTGTLVARLAHPLDRMAGGLENVLQQGQECLSSRTPTALLQDLDRCFAEGKAGELVARAHERCRREHLPVHRLQSLQIAISSYFRPPAPDT